MTQKQHIFEKFLKKDQDIFKKNYIRNWRKILGRKEKGKTTSALWLESNYHCKKERVKKKKKINNQHGIKQTHTHQTSKERKMGGQKQWKRVVPWNKKIFF